MPFSWNLLDSVTCDKSGLDCTAHGICVDSVQGDIECTVKV